MTSSRFPHVGRVGRGFGGQVEVAASPPVAALPSFPKGSDRLCMGKMSGERVRRPCGGEEWLDLGWKLSAMVLWFGV